MKWDFATRELRDIYEKGRSRKLAFIDSVLARKFVERVGRIDAAVTINDLRDPPSMRFEALTGCRNRFSIRLDAKHRLEFEIDFEDEQRTVGSVRLLSVSKHYE